TPLAVQGCTDGFGWCDVIGPEGVRGWVYAGNIASPYQSADVPVIRYGALIGIPLVTFAIGSYWGSHYQNRPWFRDRRRWEHYRPPNRPGFRPPGRPDYRPPGPPGRPVMRPPPGPRPPFGRPPGDNRPPLGPRGLVDGRQPEGRPPAAGRPPGEGRPSGGPGGGRPPGEADRQHDRQHDRGPRPQQR
ncbi:MAG: peptide-binding protein, partial [Caldimonas sp.]